MTKIEVVQLRDLKTGDQIAVKRSATDLHSSFHQLPHIGDIYFHHGIFDRGELEVIDFHGDSKADAKPKRRPILKFAAGRTELYRVTHEKCLSARKTMKMANKLVKKPSDWPDYDLIGNNCETFANYLKTGMRYSEQASQVLLKLLVAAVTAGVATAGSASVS